jgi:UDP-N-acetylglucosamine:LPS N-acetylglucosamine transferase
VIVRGRTEVYEERDLAANIRVCSHLGTEKMKQVMMQSRMIICRSGYSSLMDLVTLGKRAILVPTPGQTEQEYLARILMDKKIFFSMPQKRFDLIYALEMSVNYPGMVLQNDYRELKNRIEAVLGSVSRGSEE